MREILIYGPIYPHEARDFGIESGITDVEFANILVEAGGADIMLRFNSQGGDADAGFAMVSLIEDYAGKVSGKVDAMAASVSAVLLQATKPRVMASNSALLVHHAHISLFGGFNHQALSQIVDELKVYDDRQAGVFAKAMGKGSGEVLSMMDGEVSMKAKEAVRLGLADSISESVEVAMNRAINTKGMPPQWLAKRYTEYVDMKIPADSAGKQSMDATDKTIAKMKSLLGTS